MGFSFLAGIGFVVLFRVAGYAQKVAARYVRGECECDYTYGRERIPPVKDRVKFMRPICSS
eukprot:6390751-Amphidinium_carterae.1